MKIERLVAFVTISAVATLTCIGAMMVYRTNPEWLVAQLAAIVVGIGCCSLITIIGWKRLVSSFGSITSFVVALLCLSSLFGLSPHESGVSWNENVIPFNVSGYAILPVYVLSMCFVWRCNGRLWFALLVTAFCLVMSMFTNHPGLIRILMLTSGILIPCSIKGNKISAYVVVLGCVLFVLMRTQILGEGFLYRIDMWRSDYYAAGFSQTPWFGCYAGNGDFCPLGGAWEDGLVQAVYVLGKSILPMVAVAIILLIVAFLFVLLRRSDEGSRKILIIGSGTVLVVQMVTCYLRPFCPFVHGFRYFPFVSLNGSATLSSFILLGIALSALYDDPKSDVAALGKRIGFAFSMLLIGIGVTALGVYQHRDFSFDSAKIVQMMPAAQLGHSYMPKGAVRTDDGSIWMPYCISKRGEPAVVESIHKCKNRVVLHRYPIHSDAAIVEATCRILTDGRIAIDGVDKVGRLHSMTFSCDGHGESFE